MLARTACLMNALLLIAWPAMAGHCDSMDAQLRAEDKRLETQVTLTASPIYLGELLERLSAQTGVELSADNRDEASGMKIAIVVDKQPLGVVLDALWSLVSYQDAAWMWERGGKPGAFRYRLIRPVAAHDLANRLRQAAQEEFEKEAELMISASTMTRAQRKRLAETHKELSQELLDDDDMPGIRLFAEALPPERRLRVLRGLETPRIPFDQLSGPSLAFARSQTDGETIISRMADGTEVPTPPAQWVQFERRYMQGAIYPTLFVFFGGGGFGYLGRANMDKLFAAKIAALWILPGDKTVRAVEERKISPSDTPDPLHTDMSLQALQQLGSDESKRILDLRMRSLECHVVQLAQAAPLSLLVILPVKQPQLDYTGAPYNQTVGSFLKKLHENPPCLAHKWRQDILLLSYPAWTLDDQTLYPYNLVKQLRSDLHTNGGFLPLDDLATAAESLSNAQLLRLAEEFPVMKNVASLRKLFLLCHHYPQLAGSGVPLNDEIAAALRSVPGIPIEKELQSGKVTTVRLVDKRNKSGIQPGREIDFQLLSNEETIVSYVSFSDRGHAAN